METKSGSTEIDHRPLQSPAARTDKVERRRVSGQLAQQKFRRKRKEQAAAIQERLESLELNAQALEEQVAEWKSRALSAEQRIEESEKTVSGLQNIVESFQNTIQSIRQASDSLHNVAKALWIPRQPQPWGTTQATPALRNTLPGSNVSHYHQHFNSGFISPVSPISMGP
jgi:seryl-tRNA synthetase